MILAVVDGSVVATHKHPHYKGQKILIVQPIDPGGRPVGQPLLALDGVQAGPGDVVLVFDEGGSSRLIVGEPESLTIRTAIGAVVDRIDLADPDEE